LKLRIIVTNDTCSGDFDENYGDFDKRHWFSLLYCGPIQKPPGAALLQDMMEYLRQQKWGVSNGSPQTIKAVWGQSGAGSFQNSVFASISFV